MMEVAKGQARAKESGKLFSWHITGKPVAVLMDEEVGSRIRSSVPAAATAGARSKEIGGVLLGRVQELSQGRWSVQIHDVERLECEHALNESYTLTIEDKSRWSRRLRQLMWERPNGYVPVGWFRTHTRKGLYMDQHDLEFMQLLFPHPSSVALIVRPGKGADLGTAGFFIWENGDMERAQPQQPFAFPPNGIGFDVETAPEAASAPMLELPPLLEPVRQPKRVWLWGTAAAGALVGILWQPAGTGAERPQRVLTVVEEAVDVEPVLPSVPSVRYGVNEGTDLEGEREPAEPETPVELKGEEEPEVVARRRRPAPVIPLDPFRSTPRNSNSVKTSPAVARGAA